MSTQTTPKSAETARRLLKQISQAQIIDFEAHVRDYDTLRRQLKEKEEIIDVLETAMIGMLEKGYSQESGDRKLVLTVSTRRATPKYKELFATIAGPKAVETAQAEAGVTETKHLKVESSKVDV